MDTNTVFSVVFPTLTIIIAVFVMFQNLNKKIDALKDELYDFKLEMKIAINELGLKTTINTDNIAASNKRIDKIETNYIDSLQKIADNVTTKPPAISPAT